MVSIGSSGYSANVPTDFNKARAGLLAMRKALLTPQVKSEVSFQARYDTRTKYAKQATYASRAIYSARDIIQKQATTAQEDVYETRTTTIDTPVYETRVSGSVDLRGIRSGGALGMTNGADFAVRVGSGAEASFTFSQVLTAGKITVKQGATLTDFTYNTNSSTGFQDALKNALNTVPGLTTSYNSSGKLAFTTANAQTLTFTEVPNGLLDLSNTALDKLGIVAGTTNAQVVRTDRTTTNEQVKTGTRTVVTGMQDVKVGTERVQTGAETYQSGTRLVADGVENVLVGYDRIETNTRSDNPELSTGQSSLQMALGKLIGGTSGTIQNGDLGAAIAKDLARLSESLGSTEGLTLDKISAALKRLDKSRAAYMAASLYSTGANGTSGFVGTSLSILG